MYQKYTKSNASSQKLINFKQEGEDLYIISKIENESSRKRKKVNKSDKGIERELIGTEIVFNTIFKKRKIDKMYNVISQQQVLNANGDITGRTDISLIDKKRNQLRYAVIEFKDDKKVSKENLNSDFNGQLSNYLFEDGSNYYGNYFATIIYTNVDILLASPNKIFTYMNLTEEKRIELGTKTLKKYGIYIESRMVDKSNKTIREDKKDYVIPELVNSIKKHHDYGTYNYVKVSDSINIPTNSPYPEQLKNLRDLITAAIGSNSSDASDSRNKRALVNEVTNTILKNVVYEINPKTAEPEVYFNDEDVISIYGRVKEFFCAKNKTIFINHGRAEDSDIEELSICSCSSALVDGQNSVHSMSIILLLLNILKADFSGELNQDLINNSHYRSFRKIFDDNDFFQKNESNSVSLKKIKLLIDAINNLNIQINIQPLSPYYLNRINDIIRAKNYSIKVSGNDNKLFVYQKEIPLIQEMVMEDTDLQGFILKYPKSITTTTEDIEDSILSYRDFEELESQNENDTIDLMNQISLNDLIFPHSIIKEKELGGDVTPKLKKVFKGNTYTSKDIKSFFEMIEPFKETQLFKSRKDKLEKTHKDQVVQLEKLRSDHLLDKNVANLAIKDLDLQLKNELLTLRNKESIVNKKGFKEFKKTLIEFNETKDFFHEHIEAIKSEISSNMGDKRLFGTYLAFSIENNVFGKRNIDLIKWAKTMDELIKTRNSLTEFINDYIGEKGTVNYDHVMQTLAKGSIIKKDWIQ